jgi:hypothetical protein
LDPGFTIAARDFMIPVRKSVSADADISCFPDLQGKNQMIS